MVKKKEEKDYTPSDYFNYIKGKKNTLTQNDLEDFYNGCLVLAEKYLITGQKKVVRKLKFLTDCVPKEKQLIDLGISNFVYREDIEDYIDHVTDKPVKIIELENYPREVPDDIVDAIAQTKDIFDQLYVVFTDYTGEIEKHIAKERRDKDPILFGTFQKRINPDETRSSEILINDRFYYIGDWVDDYCDLTMDKFIKESGKDKLHKIDTPHNIEDIQKELNSLDDNLKRIYPPKSNIFTRIKNVFKKR